MGSNPNPDPICCYPKGPKDWPNTELYNAAKEIGSDFNIIFAWVSSEENFTNYLKNHWQEEKPWDETLKQIAVLWKGGDNLEALYSWRSGMIEENVHLRVIFLDDVDPPEKWEDWLKDQLGDWTEEIPDREEPAFTIQPGSSASSPKMELFEPGADPLPLMISRSRSIRKLIESLDECKMEYRACIGSKVGDKRAAVTNALQKVFGTMASDNDKKDFQKQIETLHKTINEKFKNLDCRKLPRILLLGPSGCGKSLAARYVARRTSPDDQKRAFRPYKRISIPEYLGRTASFEYELFGYCPGAFTDSRKSGSPGTLIQNMGGVVFFDEIGSANAEIQAKLLAYLDDYLVTPRDWTHHPLLCPMLIVAATNQYKLDDKGDIVLTEAKDKTVDQTVISPLRNDLLQRFNYVLEVPPLSERPDELPGILQNILQQDFINKEVGIKEVGKDAFHYLEKEVKNKRFEKGNFRQLEKVLREACTRAQMQGRDYLTREDIQRNLER